MLFCMGRTGHSVNSKVYTHPFVALTKEPLVHVAVLTLPKACKNVTHEEEDSVEQSALKVVSKP